MEPGRRESGEDRHPGSQRASPAMSSSRARSRVLAESLIKGTHPPRGSPPTPGVRFRPSRSPRAWWGDVASRHSHGQCLPSGTRLQGHPEGRSVHPSCSAHRLASVAVSPDTVQRVASRSDILHQKRGSRGQTAVAVSRYLAGGQDWPWFPQTTPDVHLLSWLPPGSVSSSSSRQRMTQLLHPSDHWKLSRVLGGASTHVGQAPPELTHTASCSASDQTLQKLLGHDFWFLPVKGQKPGDLFQL